MAVVDLSGEVCPVVFVFNLQNTLLHIVNKSEIDEEILKVKKLKVVEMSAGRIVVLTLRSDGDP